MVKAVDCKSTGKPSLVRIQPASDFGSYVCLIFLVGYFTKNN